MVSIRGLVSVLGELFGCLLWTKSDWAAVAVFGETIGVSSRV